MSGSFEKQKDQDSLKLKSQSYSVETIKSETSIDTTDLFTRKY